MTFSLLESLRRLVRQDLRRLETPVGNFHGPVVGQLQLSEDSVAQSWLKLTTTGTALLSLEEFYQHLNTSDVNQTTLEPATDGVLMTTTSVGQVTMLRTMITSDQFRTVRCELEVEEVGSRLGVYLDGILLRTTQGRSAVPITLSPGAHVLTVVTQAPKVTVRLPRNFSFTGTVESLAVPQWRRLTTGYLDAQNGTLANTLEWVTTPEAGGYRVLRRKVVYLADFSVLNDGRILTIGDVTANNTYVVTVEGDQTAGVDAGSPVLCDGLLLGYLVRAVVNEDGDTELLLRLPDETTPPQELVGALTYTGTLLELVRVPTLVTPVLTYTDTAVTAGELYEYALQSYGRLDASTYSATSSLEQVRAGDFEAPGPVTFVGTPTVLDRRVTVRFTTPADTDYQGVRVYWRRYATNAGAPYTVQSIAGDVVTIQAGTLSSVVGHRLQFAGSLTTYFVLSHTANTLVLSLTPPAQAPGTEIELWTEDAVKTDYGSPGTEDELSFAATQYGTYVFETFDRSGNEQVYDNTVTWDYAPTDDRFSGPPVLALRQLSSAEQANFAGYTDTTRYAVVEVYAYDPQQVAASATTGVIISYQKEGEVVRTLSTITGTFPTTISGAQTIDNPPSGTRTRYIAVSRTAPKLRVWATNALQMSSDITTFVADHDSTPAITSVETTIVNATNAIQFTAVVDDDTACVEWKVDDQGPYLVNTSSLKRFSMPGDFPYPSNIPILVDLGQRRELRLTPYTVDVTGFTQPQKDAVAGELVVRELVRTPRSYVSLEDKDGTGARSAEWVTATFTQSPAGVAQVLTGSSTAARSGTVALSSSPNRITDAGVAWTASQWKSSSTNHFYALVTAVGYASVLRRIVDNGTTWLDLEGWASPVANVTYQILDGAVLVRTGAEAFLPTTGIDVHTRTATFTYEFYGTKNGCYAENIRSLRVDADSLPSLDGFGYDYNSSTSQLTVRFDTPDDDATTWEVYERKGGWPNSTSSSPGTAPTTVSDLLPQYLRFSAGVDRTSYTRSVAGNESGTWYAVAVPKNSFGESGTLSTASINLGSPPVTPRLTRVIFSPSTPTDSDIRINFTTSNASNGAGVTLVCVRQDNPATQQTLTPTVTDNAGSVDLAIGETIVSQGTPGAVSRTWQVTATLNGQNTIVVSIQVWVSGGSGSVELASVTNSVEFAGSCGANCGSAESSSHSRLITWSALVNLSPMTAVTGASYYVDIEVATDAGGSSWIPLVSGLPASPSFYRDSSQCLYEPPTGPQYTAYWKYRVTLLDVSGVVDGPVAAETQLSAGVSWCSGNQF